MDTNMIPEEFEKIVEFAFKQLVKTVYPTTVETLKKKYDQLTAEKKANVLKAAQEAIKDKNLTDFLRYKYASEPMLERCGYLYPVAVYPARADQQTDIESVLRKPLVRNLKDKREEFIVNDGGEYRRAVDDLFAEPKDVNNMTYSMHNLSLEDGLVKMLCGFGTFFDSYDTSEALEWEIRTKADRLRGNSVEDYKRFEAKLPMRQKLHANVANPVLDATGRQPAVGMATLIAYKEKDSGEYQLMVRRRAQKGVPVRAGQLHVIPSFMFQPTTTIGVNSEYSVEYNFFRELLEELYKYPEAEEDGDPNQIYHEAPVKLLQSMIAAKTATLYFTGMSVNLLNLRPEICTLLVISDPAWYERSLTDKDLKWKSCKEFATLKDHTWLPKEQMIGKISFSAENDQEMLEEGLIHPWLTVPSGAAAFWLGVDVLKQVAKK